jgi:NADH-quinone oxidoreductase subunit H
MEAISQFFSYGEPGFRAVAALIKVVFLMLALGPGIASILTWLERRQSSMMQDRLGPNRANIGRFKAWGITHFLADALKFLFKEDFVPPKAHKFLFALAPILALAPALIVAAIIPFGPPLCWGRVFEAVPLGQCAQPVDLQIARLDVGILFYFAIASLSVYGATLAGWASYNKWALMGGLRASSQMVSYEVTMGMAVLAMFLFYGTLEPGAMVPSSSFSRRRSPRPSGRPSTSPKASRRSSATSWSTRAFASACSSWASSSRSCSRARSW